MRRRLIISLAALLILLPTCRERAQPTPSVDSLKVQVSESGLYRVDIATLQRAGFPLSALQDETIYLTEAGADVPFLLDEDGLLFYGRASTSRYTPFRSYILRAGQNGTQMTTESAAGDSSQGSDLPQIQRTKRLEENVEYVSDARVDGSTAPWFWQTIGLQEPEPIEFDLHNVEGGAGILRASFVGISHHTSKPDHDIRLLLNGSELGEFSWDGQTAYTATVALPAGTLQEGTNYVQFRSLPKDYLDISKLDWLEIVYDSRPVAQDNYLQFSASPGAVALAGFSERPIVVDISDPREPLQLTAWDGGGRQVRLALSREATLVAAADDGFLEPAAIEPVRHGRWDDDTQQADLLILTTSELVTALGPLVAAREEQGLTVALVPVEEIYDAFGYGAATPDSINRFITFAFEKWQRPAPRYLLLVGDATIDHWGHLSVGSGSAVEAPQNIIPSYFVPVNFGGETVSDARLADVNGDYLPDLSVGRWPVDSVAEVRDLVRRTLAYEKQQPLQRALFIVDGSSNEFEHVTDSIIEASNFPRQQSDVLRGPSVDTLAEKWRAGAWLVTYTGHGSLQLWSKDGILSTESVSSVHRPGISPIVLQLTCLTGLFAHPEITSLSEVMLTDQNGPVLVVGATSLTLSLYQEPFATALLRALQDPSVARIGDALQLARSNLNVDVVGFREISDTFVLFGDPSARIIRPQ